MLIACNSAALKTWSIVVCLRAWMWHSTYGREGLFEEESGAGDAGNRTSPVSVSQEVFCVQSVLASFLAVFQYHTRVASDGLLSHEARQSGRHLSAAPPSALSTQSSTSAWLLLQA